MENRLKHILLGSLLVAFAVPAFAQEEERRGSSVLDRIITPDMERREVDDDELDTEDFEIGFFTGVMNIEDFGSNSVAGVRFAYHVTEDFFLEANYAQSTLKESAYERLSGFPSFVEAENRDLTYYNLSIGYNIFPGEVFIGENWAFNTSFYIVAGAGNTSFADEEHFTYSFGGGMRLLLTDWMAFHVDVRDHIFTYDLLAEETTTQNLEAHMGLTIFF